MAPPVSAQPADHQEQPDQQLLDKLYKHKQLDKPSAWQDSISFCFEGDFQGAVEQVQRLREGMD